MRIHLISPTHYLRDGSLHKTTPYWTSGITLPYLKALTPPPHEVTFTDELMADLDVAAVEREADLVGITAMGPQIRRAYDLADHFRARGKQVVLGGTWVSLTPEASLAHADAVVAGEAEHVWPTLPVDDVIADVRQLRSFGARRLLFLDDNPIGRPDEAKELFRRLIPERVQWVSQTTINIARDPEMLDLAARSGARILSIGLESLSEESLSSVGKQFNRPGRFAEDIRKLRARGIQVIALVIVGLDGATTETFAATPRRLEENQLTFLDP